MHKFAETYGSNPQPLVTTIYVSFYVSLPIEEKHIYIIMKSCFD